LFTRISCTRNPIIAFPCYIIVRQSGYLIQHLRYILVKVLHYSLIRWEWHATSSQDNCTLAGELVGRQHIMTRLHRRLTLRSISGTLGVRVAIRVTTRVVVNTPLMVTPGQASKLETLPPLGTQTGTLLWRGTSVMGQTKLSMWQRGSDDSSDRYMILQLCKQKCKHPLTYRPA
jgi:hypothetical protein